MKGKIAFEEHFSTPETLIDSERPHGNTPIWPELKHNLLDMTGTRLEKMDKLGIEKAELSLNAPVLQAMWDTKATIELARRSNDFLAEVAVKHPKRFLAFAALPMQDPEAAAKELTRCVKELGFVGALVNGYTERDQPGSAFHYDLKEYWPFWAQVDGHPWLLTAAWSFGVETATHALRMICSGLFDAYPKLQIILGHLGEGLPYVIWRADHRIEKDPRGITIKKKVNDYFRQNFWVTTSGNFHTQTLLDCMWELGSDRILFASDFPFEDMEEAAEWFDGVDINVYDKRKIAYENANRLLKLEKKMAAGA